MSLSAQIKAHVVGKRIKSMTVNRSWDKGREQWVYDPTITLSDGTFIRFVVQETETSDYGIEPIIVPLAGRSGTARTPYSGREDNDGHASAGANC